MTLCEIWTAFTRDRDRIYARRDLSLVAARAHIGCKAPRGCIHTWAARARERMDVVEARERERERAGENVRAHKCEFKRRNKNTLKSRVNERARSRACRSAKIFSLSYVILDTFQRASLLYI